jgi:hypothetical protein
MEPFESYVRDKIGVILPPDRLGEAPEVVRRLVRHPARFRQQVQALRSDWVFNLGRSGEAGGEAIARVARESASTGPLRAGEG